MFFLVSIWLSVQIWTYSLFWLKYEWFNVIQFNSFLHKNYIYLNFLYFPILQRILCSGSETVTNKTNLKEKQILTDSKNKAHWVVNRIKMSNIDTLDIDLNIDRTCAFSNILLCWIMMFSLWLNIVSWEEKATIGIDIARLSCEYVYGGIFLIHN